MANREQRPNNATDCSPALTGWQAGGGVSGDCIFCKIAAKTTPATLIHEDEQVAAFHDINPQAPTHVIIIPREHITTVNELQPPQASLIGRLILVAKELARTLHLDRGYRLVMNCGPYAGQSVDHVHLHLLGGRPMRWPPG